MSQNTGCCGCGPEEMDFGTPLPKPRGCTDTVWLLFFVLFTCVMILIAGFALVYGNPKRLINGVDSFGNICGEVNEKFGNMSFSGIDMTDKPIVFFFDPRNVYTTTRICVKDCPPRLDGMEDLRQLYENISVSYCRYDFNFTSSTDWTEEVCPEFPVYSSHPVLNRCVPKLDEQQQQRFLQIDILSAIYGYLNGLGLFQQVLGDLARTWRTVLLLTSVAFVISLCLVVILHWMTTIVAYLILVLSSALSLALTLYLWWIYFDLKRMLDWTKKEMMLDEICQNERAFLTFSIISTIFTIILLLVAFVVRKKVAFVVKLFREAGSAMIKMPCLWIQPFITYTALAIFFTCWLYIVLCIATSDYPTKRHVTRAITIPPDNNLSSSSSMSNLEFDNSTELPEELAVLIERGNASFHWEDLTGWTLIEYSDGVWVKYLWFIYIFGMIWCSEFILACQQMVIASSVSTWYFSRSRGSQRCIVLKSFLKMFQYHMGSIALGSLIITFIKLPRLVLNFLQRFLRRWEEYRVIQLIARGCNCCLKCFESCMKYVHHNAYTVISIQGVNFCPASKLAFSALVQNALQISVINSIGDFVLLLAKCIVASLTGLIAIAIFRNNEELYYYAIPTVLTIVFSYFVAHCVISVFEMAVDTLFLCFTEDFNMNDGTDGKQFYAPPSLLQYMTVDAVDAVAPGRRVHIESPSRLKEKESEAISPEEIIPMNPYNSTTTPNV